MKIKILKEKLKNIYNENNDKLLFHGWHHIQFVAKKAREFSDSIGADSDLVEVSALVHDLNYLVDVKSGPQAGADLRIKLLTESGYANEEIKRIEEIVTEGDLRTRDSNISKEGKALSDADTLFKALPITPIIFAGKYIIENKTDIYKLADKVVSEQKPLFEEDIYFYTDLAKDKYLHWAKDNLNLWINVQEALKDDDVKELLDSLK